MNTQKVYVVLDPEGKLSAIYECTPNGFAKALKAKADINKNNESYTNASVKLFDVKK